MRKEVVIAIAIGIVVGLVFAFGIWRLNSTVNTKTEFVSTETDSIETSSGSSIYELSLTLIKPDELDVITQSPWEFSGVTRTKNIIIISGESEDYITAVDDSGSFTQNVELVGGINRLNIASISTDGQTITKQLTLVYSTEFEADIEDENTDTPPATEEAEILEEKIRDKISLQKSKPKAYIGIITDKTEESLQIRNSEAEIQLISVKPEDVSFVKINDTTTTIKYEDLAIGDFIAVMGLTNGNGVLTAKRVIVTNPLEEITRKIVFGRVTNIQKSVVTLEEQGGISWTLEFPKRWKGPEKNELDIDQKIIAVGEPDAETLKIRTIYIVTNSESDEE